MLCSSNTCSYSSNENMCAVQNKTRVQRSALNLEAANSTKFSDRFDCSSRQFFSVEVCSNRSINKELLQKLAPKFCSVPWHLAAHNPEQDVLSYPSIILTESLTRDGYTVLQHIPCGYLSRRQAFRILDHLVTLKVRDIFIIRGDLQLENDDQRCEFKFASLFVKFVKQFYGNFFCIGVAGYVDSHPLSPDQNLDLIFLKEKVDSGADFIITQMVFDFDAYYIFLNKCKNVGINIPIIPGLYIIHSWNEFASLTRFCKVNVPKEVVNVILGYKENQQAILEYGLRLCRKFIKKMSKKDDLTILNVHFFSLNDFEHIEKLSHIFNS